MWSVKFQKFFKTINQSYFRDLVLTGISNTILVAILGFVLGIAIGTIIGVVKVAPKYKRVMRVLDKICTVYVAIFRGTPMVVQLLLTYYVILPAMGIGGVNALRVGIIVFGMNSGAYVSEIMRGGIKSVDGGQLEAGRALGLSYPVTMWKIVIPQAIKNILPTLGNEFITLIKETSVLSFITVYDIYSALNAIGAKNYEKMVPFLFLALIYIILVLLISLGVKLMEQYFARSESRRGMVRRHRDAGKA